MAGVTDQLIRLIELAKKQDDSYLARLSELKEKHFQACRELSVDKIIPGLETDFAAIAEVLRAVRISKTCSEETLELIAGHGELWSAQIFQAHLQAIQADNSRFPRSRWLDARKVLVVRPGETGPVVDWEVSTSRLAAWLKTEEVPWVVITGYIASTPDGVATTMKRASW